MCTSCILIFPLSIPLFIISPTRIHSFMMLVSIIMFYPHVFCKSDLLLSFHRGRRGQRDKIPVCQDWIDLDLDHTVNPIESIEPLTEMVDGKEKVCLPVLILSWTFPLNVWSNLNQVPLTWTPIVFMHHQISENLHPGVGGQMCYNFHFRNI